MKFRAFLILSIVLLKQATFASTTRWTMIDDFYVPQKNLKNQFVALIQNGTSLFSVGMGNSGTEKPTPIFLRRSVDNGMTWQTIDVYRNFEDKVDLENARLIADSSGTLFFVTTETPYIEKFSSTFVRASFDNGQTWNVVDRYTCPGKDASSSGASISRNQSVLVAIKCGNTIIIRQSMDHGQSWVIHSQFETFIDDYVSSFIHSNDGLVISMGHAVLRFQENNTFKKWVPISYPWDQEKIQISNTRLVRLNSGHLMMAFSVPGEASVHVFKSQDHGATWKLNSHWAPSSEYDLDYSFADIVVDKNDHIFLLLKASNNKFKIVSNVDNYWKFEFNQRESLLSANFMFFDSTGVLYVGGSGFETNESHDAVLYRRTVY